MTTLTELIEEKPWVAEYLYFDPDLKVDDVVYETNLNRFTTFVEAMENTRDDAKYLLGRYDLPDYKEIIELIAVFKVMTHYGTATVEEQELFFDMLSAHIKGEMAKGKTLDDIFEDRDAIALSRLYQVTDKKWSQKYMTWVLFELGAISRKKGPDVFGANDSAFQTYDFLKNAS
ncbi:MAG: hypothetical protein JJU01_09595, partial [Alkalibacterium sp.]|nr:hypothetical protein [Alkalibacterium sp.]